MTQVHVPGELMVTVLFFVSGAAGLIFEVVWFHRCGLVFGNSVWSTSIVLSSFMGGLALGSAWIGWRGHRSRRFLRTYAALEALVGVTGLALTLALPELEGWLAPATYRILDIPSILNLVRVVVAFSVLLVPATAMGATLPLLAGELCRWRTGFGRVVGRLYGWNTLGAVTGVVAAETVLIAHFGVTGSAGIAALLDLCSAAAALWISRGTNENFFPTGAFALEQVARRSAVWRLLLCAFLAGADLVALEVIWFRFLSMFVYTTTLAASLMLAAVLTAIGVGGLAASRWLKRSSQGVSYLPVVALAAACLSASSYMSFRFLTGGPWAAEWYRILWFAMALTFPTAFLSGVIFTLLGEALRRDIAIATRAAGWLILANTTGAMCGPLVAAFLLLPRLGMEKSFFALAIVYLVIALLAIRDTLPVLSTTAGRAFVAASLAAAVVLACFPFGWMAKKYFGRAAQVYAADGSQIIATREGSGETIFLMQKTWMGKPLYSRLVTNGYSMSGTTLPSTRYMRYFVYLPMFLHQAPLRHALVICYGLGVTAKAVTDLGSVESVDIVEISRDVTAMSDYIYSPYDHPLHDRRVRLHAEDGRYFLQATNTRYDLITGEPPPPVTTGTVNLYTREYFRLIHDRLADGGIATYWLPVPRWGQYNILAIIRAFCDVFEDCSLWNGTPFNWVLVGTRHAQGPVPEAQFWDPWRQRQPLLGQHLREVGFEMPQQVGATFLGDADYLRALVAQTPPLTDDYPQRLASLSARLLLSDPRTIFGGTATDFMRSVTDPSRARRGFETSAFIRHLWPETLFRQTLPFFESQRVLNRVLSEGGNPLQDIEDLHALLTQTHLERLPLWVLGSDDVEQHIAETGNDETGGVDYTLGLRALVARNYLLASDYLAKAEQRGLQSTTVRPLLVYALCLAGKKNVARELAAQVVSHNAVEADFWEWMESEFGVQPGD